MIIFGNFIHFYSCMLVPLFGGNGLGLFLLFLVNYPPVQGGCTRWRFFCRSIAAQGTSWHVSFSVQSRLMLPSACDLQSFWMADRCPPTPNRHHPRPLIDRRQWSCLLFSTRNHSLHQPRSMMQTRQGWCNEMSATHFCTCTNVDTELCMKFLTNEKLYT